MPSSNLPKSARGLQFKFFNVRHISCPEDIDNDRKVYVGYAPINSILQLPTNENVRDYLLEAEGRQRRRPTQVHKAIRDTLENHTHNFSVLNSGVVIVARECEIDETSKCLYLRKASILNGSQTQGIVSDFLRDLEANGNSSIFQIPHVKFELIVTNDEDLIAEVSIARNFQNDVMTISIAGRLGELNELDESFQRSVPELQLQKSETKLSEDYVKTERLLQVITALVPKQIWPKTREFNKVYAYSMKARCLKEFREIYSKAKNQADPDNVFYKELYQFYLDIAGQAYKLYDTWKSHQGFQGSGLHAIEREGRKIKEVPDGIIFPIIASYSAFARKKRSGWVIEPPPIFDEGEMIRTAKSVYIEIASSNPNFMGKSRACYSSLLQITTLYSKLSK